MSWWHTTRGLTARHADRGQLTHPPMVLAHPLVVRRILTSTQELGHLGVGIALLRRGWSDMVWTYSWGSDCPLPT